jgi:hypothetical protein
MEWVNVFFKEEKHFQGRFLQICLELTIEHYHFAIVFEPLLAEMGGGLREVGERCCFSCNVGRRERERDVWGRLGR